MLTLQLTKDDPKQSVIAQLVMVINIYALRAGYANIPLPQSIQWRC